MKSLFVAMLHASLQQPSADTTHAAFRTHYRNRRAPNLFFPQLNSSQCMINPHLAVFCQHKDAYMWQFCYIRRLILSPGYFSQNSRCRCDRAFGRLPVQCAFNHLIRVFSGWISHNPEWLKAKSQTAVTHMPAFIITARKWLNAVFPSLEDIKEL